MAFKRRLLCIAFILIVFACSTYSFLLKKSEHSLNNRVENLEKPTNVEVKDLQDSHVIN